MSKYGTTTARENFSIKLGFTAREEGDLGPVYGKREISTWPGEDTDDRASDIASSFDGRKDHVPILENDEVAF